MNWKLCSISLLISTLFVASPEISAQTSHNIDCITQYNHNWQDGISDVVVNEDYAYLACRDDGFRIVNISNLDAPFDVGQFPISNTNTLALAGKYVYVGGYGTGLHILDVSDPASPLEVRQIPLEGSLNVVVIAGNYAFVGSHFGGFCILDITDPSNAEIVWSTSEIHEVADIEIHDDFAYLCSGYDMLILDISEISSPQVIDSFRTGYDTNEGIAVSGNHAYLASGFSGMQVVDLQTGQVVAGIDSLYYAYGVDIVDGLLYVHYGDFDCPLAMVDISDPLSPQTLGVYYPPADLLDFYVDGDLVYIADNEHGLRVVDVSDPAYPLEIASYSRYGEDLDVTLADNLAFVREDLKLKVVDISDLQHPRELGYYEMNWPYGDLRIAGDVGYITTHGYTCLYAIDLSDPQSLNLLGTFTVASGGDVHYRMALYEHYAYLVENGGLRIVDVADPFAMQEVGYFDQHIGNARVEAYEGKLFLISGSGGNHQIQVLDLSDPTSPTVIGSAGVDNYGRDIVGSDGKLYVATPYTFYIFDLLNFQQWTPIAAVEMPAEITGYIGGLDIEDNYVYLAVIPYGLCVYDVTDPASPRMTGYCETPGAASGVAARDGFAVVADGDNLGFYDCSAALPVIIPTQQSVPEAFSLLTSYPNPFNASTQIRFALAERGCVALRIYDVLGRNVVTLADREFLAGSHTVYWNGTDQAGQALASGRYYVQASIGNDMRILSIVLLK